MQTYVISLETPTKLMDKLNSMHLNPILVEGVRGSTLTQTEINKNTTPLYSNFGPLSAIGCALAHIKVWKLFLKSNNKYALIFEDDCVFVDDFYNKLGIVMRHIPDDTDILYLGCFGCTDINFKLTYLNNIYKSKIVKINKYINKPAWALEMHSYIITKTGANKLINNIDTKISNHVDVIINNLNINNKINIYASNPLLAFQASNSINSNNISNKHPKLINNIIQNKYLAHNDIGELYYIFNVSLMRIGTININIFSVLFLFFGIICAIFNISLLTITLVYFIISIYDIPDLSKYLFFHYFLFIFPCLINKLIRKIYF